jgi:hypothetical protein
MNARTVINIVPAFFPFSFYSMHFDFTIFLLGSSLLGRVMRSWMVPRAKFRYGMMLIYTSVP